MVKSLLTKGQRGTFFVSFINKKNRLYGLYGLLQGSWS